MIDNTDELKVQKTVGSRIKELRKAAGIRAVDLAHGAGISQGQLSKIETGKAKLSINVLTRLTRILERPLAYLFQSELAVPRLMGTLSTAPASEMAGLNWLIKEVGRRTDAKVTIVPMTPDQLGTARNQVELLQQGVIDIFIEELFFFHHYAPAVNILTIPYAFKNDDYLTSFLKSDYFEKSIRMPLQNKGIKLLTKNWNWRRGVQWALVSPKAVITPMDLKGLRVRIYDSPALGEYWKGMGAEPVVIPWAEVKKAWSKGRFDVLPTRKSHIYPYGFCQFGKYVTLLGDVCPRIAVTANRLKYEILPPSIQQGIESAVTAAEVYFSNGSYKMEEENEPLNMAKYQAIYLKVDLNPWKERSAKVHERLVKSGIVPHGAWLAAAGVAAESGFHR